MKLNASQRLYVAAARHSPIPWPPKHQVSRARA